MPPRYQRPYPPDFWREAVGLVRASGRSIPQSSRNARFSSER